MKTSRKTNRPVPLGAGLLIIGGFAPLFGAASQTTPPLAVTLGDGLVAVSARGVAAQAVLDEIAATGELRLIQDQAVDSIVDLETGPAPLARIVHELLPGRSYQLLEADADENDGEAGLPRYTLWIFPANDTLAPAQTVSLEAVLLFGDWREKADAVRQLRMLGSVEAVETLCIALADPDANVRDPAFEALAGIGTDASLAAIASLQGHRDPQLRIKVADALSRTHSESALRYLELALRDPDPNVRVAAVDALAAVPHARSGALLRRALEDSNVLVREHAADALEDLGAALAYRDYREAGTTHTRGDLR